MWKAYKIDIVAPPGNGLVARGDFQARQIVDRTVRAMLPLNPLRINQRHRPRLGGNGELGVEQSARRFVGVDF